MWNYRIANDQALHSHTRVSGQPTGHALAEAGRDRKQGAHCIRSERKGAHGKLQYVTTEKNKTTSSTNKAHKERTLLVGDGPSAATIGRNFPGGLALV